MVRLEPAIVDSHGPAKSVWQPDWMRWEPTTRSKVKANNVHPRDSEVPEVLAPTAQVQQEERLIPTCTPLPDEGTEPALSLRATHSSDLQQDAALPLVLECPGIPQWILPFPQVNQEE